MSNNIKFIFWVIFITISLSTVIFFFVFLNYSSSNAQALVDMDVENLEEISNEDVLEKVVLNEKENNSENDITEIKVSTIDSYYIKVNTLTNVVNIYKYDVTEKYLVPFKAFICSIGDDTPVSRHIYYTE